MISGIKAVLFDLDETLIDDFVGLEAAHRAVAKRLDSYLRDCGVKVGEEEIFAKVTKLDDKMNFERKYIRNDWWLLLLAELGIKVELPQNLLDELTLLYWKTFAENTEPYPDTEQTLDYLKKKGYKLGIITDTDGTKGIKKMRLDQLAIVKVFDVVIVSGEDTPRTKPDPKPYLLAAGSLGVKPNECVFVGDKPFTDIDGGNAAGMKTILLKRRDWGVKENPDFTVKSMSDLCGIL
ncbi:MAG: HAD-IIIA family hydrolase [Methanobacteriota archaeon]